MAGVYISYPFCGQKCTYCNFASGVLPRSLEESYIEALQSEIAGYEWMWRPETLYLGGGSPSRIKPEVFEKVLAAVPGRPWREATLEVAPGDVTAEKARLWRDTGITRVSLGVQSFVQREIARTGRKHSAEVVATEVGLLRQSGIERINIDLIAGLAGQTTASWCESLQWIERLQPEHVSVYMLEVDEDSRLGRELLRGSGRYGADDVPHEEVVIALYEHAVDHLASLGLQRYEISNFSRPGCESLHNLKYWRLEPYAGFGTDAHSFDGCVRRRNVESAAEYVERWQRGESSCVEETPANTGEERFFVGLRLSEGVQPLPEEWRRFATPIHRFLDEGLLETEGQYLRLTRQGVLLSNEVFQEFVNL
jgi:oxygen-independent coproporphyrinogen-3 oxidase